MPSELEIVGEVAEALSTAPNVQQALERTLELVTGLLGLETGWVWLIDPETGHIYAAAARNLPPYLQEPVRMSGAPCWCINEFRDGSLSAQQHRRDGVQPVASGGARAGDGADARPGASRIRAAELSGQAAGHHEHHRAGHAQADQGGAAPACPRSACR